MSAGGIRAGKAFVEIGADTSQLQASLRKMNAVMKEFGNQVRGIGLAMSGLGATIIAPLAASTKIFSDFGDSIAKSAARIGFSVESMSSLGFAARQSGAEAADLEAGMRKLARTVTAADKGSKAAADSLAAIGLTASELQRLSPEGQFKLIADRIAAIQDPTRRAASAMDVLGKSGTKLIPMMAGGAAGINALQQEAAEAGLVLSGLAARDAERLNDAMGKLGDAVKATAFSLGGTLAPALTDLLGDFSASLRSAGAWIREHSELVKIVAASGAAFVGFGAALAAVGVAIGAVLTPAGAIAAAIAAIGAVAVATSGGVDKLSEATRRATDAGDKQRATDIDRLARLQSLSQKNTKTAAELAEQKLLVEQLKDRYGSFGSTIDNVTGNVHLAADAFDRLANSITLAATKDVSAEIAALDKEIAGLQSTIRGRGGPLSGKKGGLAASVLTEMFGSSANIKNDLDQLNRAVDARTALQKRLRDLRGGNLKAATSGPQTGPGVFPAVPPGASEAARRNLHELAVERVQSEAEIQDMRLRGMEETLDREVALIRNRYDTEIKLARLAGNEQKAQFASFEKGIALAQAFQKQQEQDRIQQQDADAFNQRSADDLARTRIDSMPDGLRKQLALNDLNEQSAVRDALNSGIPADKIDFDAIHERFVEVGRQLAKDFAPKVTTSTERSTFGTFNASALWGQGGGSAEERTAKATEEIVRLLRRDDGIVY